jgi:hypothetical protein
MVSSVPSAVVSRGVTCLVVALLVACTACDKKDSDAPVTARPGSRLAWNQNAGSVSELRSLSFRLYLDETASSLTDVRCSETNTGAGYECSAGLPSMSTGRHTLQLTSVLVGIESARSAPLTINYGATLVAESPALSLSNDASAEAGTVPSFCVSDSASQTCDRLRPVATALHAASSLTAIPDGRLLLVERDSLVRIVADGRLLPEAALALQSPSSQIVGLAVDARFATSRSVFVAWTSGSRNGVELNVTRYRELQNTLGEGAVIVAGLPFQAGLRAPLAVDGDGLLYVALPTTPRAPAAMLRFTRDGLVPSSNPRLSPVIASGFARPSDLEIDVITGRVWTSGSDLARPYTVVAFASIDEFLKQVDPEPVLGRISANDAPTLAVLRRSAQDPAPSLLIALGGRLSRGEITARAGPPNLRPLPIEPEVPILSVAEGPAGSWYVLTGAEGGAQSLFQLSPG